jgi:hypothetical protein
MRRFHAHEAGAASVLDPTNDDIASFCHTLGDGYGAHAVFDCAGVQAAFDVAIASVRGKGSIINIALYETPLVIQTPNVLNKRSISYIGSNIYTRGEFQEVIDAVASGEYFMLFHSMYLANMATCRQNQKPREHDHRENIFEERCGRWVRCSSHAERQACKDSDQPGWDTSLRHSMFDDHYGKLDMYILFGRILFENSLSN